MIDKIKNQKALENPQPGDYWNEMFCPYFIVVQVLNKDQFRVLSCMGGPNSYNRQHEPNAKIDLKDGWCFDYSKDMIVDRDWIAQAVRYTDLDGFVADVSNTERTQTIVQEWRDHYAKQLRKEWEDKRAEWEKFTGWAYLNE